MPDENGSQDLQAAWKDQPEERLPVTREQFANRRARELYSSTRSEILISIAAALFFVAIAAWRFAPALDRLQQFGFAAVVVWVLVSLYRFRHALWRPRPPRPAALAAPGLEYYREELERRRDHLRNEWVWHGPLVLACLVLLATVAGQTYPRFAKLGTVIPLLTLLAAWTAFGVIRRRRQANEIQREIDEINRL